ncbi:MAG: hypothetical protein IPK17_13885 [Chloroflexi bacterium]|uniref:hypothetical protein n=1 Tax=Candidatus Flexifilum breve TaxID=3140694 RepID=UPI003134B502|nr:hypothetical protein [Chloroflexota bacterium]
MRIASSRLSTPTANSGAIGQARQLACVERCIGRDDHHDRAAADLRQRLIEQLEWSFLPRGVPDHLRSDNGVEFIVSALQKWLHDRHCHTLYIKAGSSGETA